MSMEPSEHFETFFREMIRHNIGADKMAIDLTVLPREVLEQVLHFILMIQMFASTEEIDIDLQIGPDADYHHSIYGISVEASDSFLSTFLLGSDWYVIYAWDSHFTAELLIARLVEREWQAVNEEDDGFIPALTRAEEILGVKGIAELVSRGDI